MGALRLGRGLGRGHHARKPAFRAHSHRLDEPDQPDQPDRPSALSERLWESESASVGSSASSSCGRDDEVQALVTRVAALEGELNDVRAIASAAAAAAASGRPSPQDAQRWPPPSLPPSPGRRLEPATSSPPHPAESASLVVGMPGAHEPPSVARRKLPPAPSPGDAPAVRCLPPGQHSPLHWEVRRFVDANDELVRRQAQLRQYAIDMLSHDVRSAWPCAQLRVYGSLATGLCSPASDIDVALVQLPPASAPQLLHALHALLAGRPHVAAAQLLPHAQVPILKLQLVVPAADGHLALVHVDVSVCAGGGPEEGHHGLAAVGHVRAALRELPALRPLTIVTKHYLAVLGLNQTYTGGLCAHAVLLLVRAFLHERAARRQRGEAKEAAVAGCAGRASAQEADPDLGAALLCLLEFYADFDFAHTQVCWPHEGADGGAGDEPVFRPRPPLAAARGYPPPPLMIDAIGNPALNVGSKAFAIGAVTAAFCRARSELRGCDPAAAPGILFSLMRLGSGLGSGVILPPPPPPPPAHAQQLRIGGGEGEAWEQRGGRARGAQAAPHGAALGERAQAEAGAEAVVGACGVEAEAEARLAPAARAQAAEAGAAEGAEEASGGAEEEAAAAREAARAAAAEGSGSSAGDSTRAGSAAGSAEPGACSKKGQRAAARRASARGLALLESDGSSERSSEAGGGGAQAQAAQRRQQAQLSEWLALHEGMLQAVRAHLDAHVARSDALCAQLSAELRGIKGVLERQLRSAHGLEEAMRENTVVITREVVRCTSAFVEKKLEHAQAHMLAALAAQSTAPAAPGAAEARAPGDGEASAGAQPLELAQCSVPVHVYDAEAGERKVIGMIRLGDAIRMSEGGSRAEAPVPDAPAAPRG